jgi:hypothetical protein
MEARPPTLRGWLRASLARDRPAVHGRFDGANTPVRSRAPPVTACLCGRHSWNRWTNFAPLISRCRADHSRLPGPTADRRRPDPPNSEGSTASRSSLRLRRRVVLSPRRQHRWGTRTRPSRRQFRRAVVGEVGVERVEHPAHDTHVVARTRRQRERPHRQHRVGRRLPRVRGGGGYTAAKHAARAVTRMLRGELWGQPVRVAELSLAWWRRSSAGSASAATSNGRRPSTSG